MKLFASVIFRLVHRFRVDELRLTALAVRVCAALLFTVIHAGGMIGVRALLWGTPALGWLTALQRTYLTNLDFLLMT